MELSVHKQKKKGQIFLFDVILSFIIILITVALVSKYSFQSFDNSDLFNLNRQIVNGFTETKINTLNNVEVRDLFIQGKIDNIENTLIEQIAVFYEEGELATGELLAEVYIENYLADQTSINISLRDTENNEINLYSKVKITKEEANLINIKKRSFLTPLNTTNVKGPYILTIELWK